MIPPARLLARVERRHAGGRDGGVEQPDPGAEHDHAGHQRAVAVPASSREKSNGPERDAGRAGRDASLGADPPVQRPGDERRRAANVPISGSIPTPGCGRPSSRAPLVMNCGRYSSAAKKIADISSTATQAARRNPVAITSPGTRASSPARRSIGRTRRAGRPPARQQAEDAGRSSPVVDLVEREQQRDEADRERATPA